jgi:carbonic anhydrase
MVHSGKNLSGRQVWYRLMKGNTRFVQGLFRGRNLRELRAELTNGQKPIAAMLSCSDSRVPAEIIFDQSLGDLFVVRTAGMVLDPTSIGSLEYAVAHLHVPLLVIKGHESCGAVTAAVSSPELSEGHIGCIIQQITPSVDQARLTGKSGPELVEEATERHLRSLEQALRCQSKIINEALDSHRLELVVAKYRMRSGKVDSLQATFFESF